MKDTFFTINAPSEGFFKDKGSKFFAYSTPLSTEAQFLQFLEKIKKEYINQSIRNFKPQILEKLLYLNIFDHIDNKENELINVLIKSNELYYINHI